MLSKLHHSFKSFFLSPCFLTFPVSLSFNYSVLKDHICCFHQIRSDVNTSSHFIHISMFFKMNVFKNKYKFYILNLDILQIPGIQISFCALFRKKDLKILKVKMSHLSNSLPPFLFLFPPWILALILPCVPLVWHVILPSPHCPLLLVPLCASLFLYAGLQTFPPMATLVMRTCL